MFELPPNIRLKLLVSQSVSKSDFRLKSDCKTTHKTIFNQLTWKLRIPHLQAN